MVQHFSVEVKTQFCLWQPFVFHLFRKLAADNHSWSVSSSCLGWGNCICFDDGGGWVWWVLLHSSTLCLFVCPWEKKVSGFELEFRGTLSAYCLLILRFSLWLIRYFLKTYIYTPSTPCRDVKFCPNIPLGDLSWNSLTELMWHHQINGFSNSKFWKNWQENVP